MFSTELRVSRAVRGTYPILNVNFYCTFYRDASFDRFVEYLADKRTICTPEIILNWLSPSQWNETRTERSVKSVLLDIRFRL